MVKSLLKGWDTYCRREGIMERREIDQLDTDVVIGFCRGLCGEEVFLTYLKGMLKLWEDTRRNKDCPHVMVMLKGRFKGETE